MVTCYKFLFACSSLLNRVLGVLACSRALRVYVFACSRAWRACVLTCLACFCAHVLNLRACYDACLACSALVYSRFCLIIVFSIKGKVLQLKESC